MGLQRAWECEAKGGKGREVKGREVKGRANGLVQVVHIPDCSDYHPLSAWVLYPTCLTRIPFYGTFFKFWVRKICTILVPFCLLLYFNVAIVLRLQRPHSGLLPPSTRAPLPLLLLSIGPSIGH